MDPKSNDSVGGVNDNDALSIQHHEPIDAVVNDDAPLSAEETAAVEQQAFSLFVKFLRGGEVDLIDLLKVLDRKKHSPGKCEQYFFSVFVNLILKSLPFSCERMRKKVLKRAALCWGYLLHYRRFLSHDDESFAIDFILKSFEKKDTDYDKQRFFFATIALQKFVDRLDDWPNYATNILDTLNLHQLRSSHPDLFPRRRLRRALAKYIPGYSHPTTTRNNQATVEPVVLSQGLAATDLSLDLIAEILAGLPVKTLLRFKSVCKDWRCLIERRDFVANHHERSKTQLLFLSTISKEDTMLSLFRQTISAMNPKPRDLPFYEITIQRGANVSQPVDGIFFVEFSWVLALWNPARRELKIIPQHLPYEGVEGGQWDRHSYEFGFDGKTNDYKVMRVDSYYVKKNKSDDDAYYCTLLAKVYRLSCHSWTEIDLLPQSQWLREARPTMELHIKGMCFWLGRDQDDRVLLISFDFCDETTTTTWLPDGYNAFLSWYMFEDVRRLFVLDGHIALLNDLTDDQQGYHEIWVLNEIGNKESWSKLYEFRPCSNLNLPLGKLGSHELFHESKIDGQLIWCNPVDPTVNRFFYPRSKQSPITNGYRYKESLFKIN